MKKKYRLLQLILRMWISFRAIADADDIIQGIKTAVQINRDLSIEYASFTFKRTYATINPQTKQQTFTGFFVQYRPGDATHTYRVEVNNERALLTNKHPSTRRAKKIAKRWKQSKSATNTNQK